MMFALPIMTFSLGLAIAGPSNWIKWTAVFLLAAMLSGVIFALGVAIVPTDGVWLGLGLFGIVPLLPALLLWLAVLVRGRKDEASTASGG
jgi:peptidoglycan/LPS O-acetylase OafA/YrhL